MVSFIRAGATLPLGAFADRMPRRAILMVAVAGWGATMVASGLTDSYTFLLLTRLLLGAATAAAWPCVASLTGDFFPARERAGIYGMIVSGELVGAGIGGLSLNEIALKLQSAAAGKLPIRTSANEVVLMDTCMGRWAISERLPLV